MVQYLYYIANNLKNQSRYFVLIIFLSSILLTATVTAPHINYKAFAQLSQQQLSGSSVIFRNVVVDANPEPNKPFKVTATIVASDIARRHVLLSLSVPKEISVTGSAIEDLGDISVGDGERAAKWTLVGATPGSFAMNLTAYSTTTGLGNVANTFQSSSFLFNVSIGSLKSLIVTKLSLPGNLLPNNVFTATMALKNTGTTPANNVVAQISVPSGLQLMDNLASNVSSIKAGEEVPFSWKLKAQTPGSFTINFNYSSTNAGSNIIQATANIGQPIINDVRPTEILLAGSQLASSIVGPGDQNLPLNITLINDGTLPLVNLTAVLELNEPFFWSYKQNGTIPIETHTQTFHAGTIKSGQSYAAPYFINVRKSANPDMYSNHLKISFSDGKQHYQRVYDVPISVSPNTALMVVAQPVPLNPGSYSPITFNLVNKGQVPLHAIQLLSSNIPPPSNPIAASTFTSSGPYLSVDTPYWIGDLGVGENKALTLKVYTPNERVVQEPLPITIGYQAHGKRITETHMIGVQFLGKPAFQIERIKVTPPLAYPGTMGIRMDMNFLNAGYLIANNVSAQLVDLPPGLTPAWGNATSQSFGRITPNQNFTGSFYMNINSDVTSAGYPLTVLFKYNNKDTQKLYANFLVSPKAKFELINVVNSNQLYPGAKTVPLQVILKNTGTAIAQTLTTQFLGGNAVPGSKSSISTSIGDTEKVGNILPGQVFTTTFILNPDPDAKSGQQPASISVIWTQTDTSGTSQTNTFIQTIPITYKVVPGPSYLLYYNGIPWTYVIIVIVIAILAIIFVIQRKRKIHRINTFLQQSQQQTPPIRSETTKDTGNGPLDNTSRRSQDVNS